MAILLFEKLFVYLGTIFAIFALNNPKASKTRFLGSNCCRNEEW
jgi:hypothetical protein